MRNLDQVISRMLTHIPTSEEGLRTELRSIGESFLYSSPEMVPHWWQKGAKALAEHFGEEQPKDGWPAEVVGVWMGDYEQH